MKRDVRSASRKSHQVSKLLSVALGMLSTAFTFSASCPTTAYAEFLLTLDSGVYQHTNSRTKVVLGTKQGARGIFVMTGNVIPPQEFNLEATPKAGVRHVFIRFDEQTNPPTYSEILIGDRSYKIRGNLTLNVGDASVGIDNSNPYLTVVASGGPTKKSSILGFSGLNEVVRADGDAAEILAANQLNTPVAALFRPYIVDESELMLNGRPVTTPVIGTFVKQENVCLTPSAIVVTGEQLKRIQSGKTEKIRLRTIDQVLAENKKRSPIKGHLVLRSDQQSVILLNVAEKNVRSMTATKATSGKRKVCVITDIDVG